MLQQGGHDGGLLSNAIVDFVREYAQPEHKGAWDCVVTTFFIDTAPNPLPYLRTIAHCLRQVFSQP